MNASRTLTPIEQLMLDASSEEAANMTFGEFHRKFLKMDSERLQAVFPDALSRMEFLASENGKELKRLNNLKKADEGTRINMKGLTIRAISDFRTAVNSNAAAKGVSSNQLSTAFLANPLPDGATCEVSSYEGNAVTFVRVPESMHGELKKEAHQLGVSMNVLCIMKIVNGLLSAKEDQASPDATVAEPVAA